MPGYADLTRAKRLLQLDAVEAVEAARVDAELGALDDALSLAFEGRVGRTWQSEDIEPEARTVAIAVDSRLFSGYWQQVVPLPAPGVTELESVTIGAEWDGVDWVGGDAVDPTLYQLTWQSFDGAYLGLALAVSFPWSAGAWWGGVWNGVLLLEALWAQDGALVPADVVDAVTFLVVEEWKAEHASPAGQIGPDGQVIPLRNPWKFERVRAALDRYTLRAAVVV